MIKVNNINENDDNDSTNFIIGDNYKNIIYLKFSGNLYGFGGDDVLNGSSQKDYLYGGDGNDILGVYDASSYDYKGAPSTSPSYTVNYGQFYNGGKGNDMMYGTRYGNIYQFELGDGNDTIVDNSSNPYENTNIDIIRFGKGISPDDISISRILNHIILTNKNNGDSITIYSALSSLNNKIEKIEFSNGSSWDWNDLIKKL